MPGDGTEPTGESQVDDDQRHKIAMVIRCAYEWCEAIQRGTSWDDWDSQYKEMCGQILPSLGLTPRAEDDQGEWHELPGDVLARIRAIVGIE